MQKLIVLRAAKLASCKSAILFFFEVYMNNLNSIIIEGNVVRKNTLLEPVAGFKKYVIPIGVNRWYVNKDGAGVSEVSYFDVETYGKMAEYTEPKALKGRGIRVVGRLKQDSWEDKEGKRHSRVYVVAEHIEYKPVLDDSVPVKETEIPSESQTENEEVPVSVVEGNAVGEVVF